MPKAKGSGLEGHYDMIADVDWMPVDKEARDKARKEAGVTCESYDFSTPGNAWDCTVYFRHGEPFRMNFYIWSANEAGMMEALSKDLGYKVTMKGVHGGNGHYTAELERVGYDSEPE
jgi:hypothetical protein